jgi:hypothetical protein
MALEDTIRSAAPGGNIGRPLMLALLALLASGCGLRAALGYADHRQLVGEQGLGGV